MRRGKRPIRTLTHVLHLSLNVVAVDVALVHVLGSFSLLLLSIEGYLGILSNILKVLVFVVEASVMMILALVSIKVFLFLIHSPCKFFILFLVLDFSLHNQVLILLSMASIFLGLSLMSSTLFPIFQLSLTSVNNIVDLISCLPYVAHEVFSLVFTFSLSLRSNLNLLYHHFLSSPFCFLSFSLYLLLHLIYSLIIDCVPKTDII